MRKGTKLFLLILLLPGLPSCKKKLGESGYASYVNAKDNGLRKSIVSDGWEYIIQYKPHEYILLMEHVKDNEREKRLRQLHGTAWFNISIRRQDGTVSPLRYNLTSRDEYDKRLNYFLNGAAKDVGLLYGNMDTLLPISYAFENNYNLSPQETMVVGFALPRGETSPGKAMKISIDDNIFGNGIIKATISKDDLDKVPGLK